MRNIACTMICCYFCCFFNGLCNDCQINILMAAYHTNGQDQLSNNWRFTVTNGLQNLWLTVHMFFHVLHNDCNNYMPVAYWNYVADTYWRQLPRPTRISILNIRTEVNFSPIFDLKTTAILPPYFPQTKTAMATWLVNKIPLPCILTCAPK